MNDDQGETDVGDDAPRPDPDATAVDDAPRPEPDATSTESSDTPLHRFLHAQDGILLFVREVLVSVSAVVALGLVLYTISGVWPPMVAVESGSMEPHMHRGDLVFITAPDRFSPDYALDDTGVVTADVGSQRGHASFGGAGSVVVFDPPSRYGSPIIHRAHFYVEEGENWYGETDPDYVNAENCEQLQYCPAPHAGFITKGDANARYDQASGIAEPVKTEWIDGVAHLRVPYLGYVRLELAGAFVPTPVAADAPVESPDRAMNASATVDDATAGPPDFESTRRTVSVA